MRKELINLSQESLEKEFNLKNLDATDVQSASVLALVNILADKGILTRDEYLNEFTSLVKEMDEEKGNK